MNKLMKAVASALIITAIVVNAPLILACIGTVVVILIATLYFTAR